MKSMTGFGTSVLKTSSTNIEVNIKTVNGRFFEIRFHLPREFSALEIELKKILNEKIIRGTVDVYVSRKAGGSGKKCYIRLQKEVAKNYQKAYQELGKVLGVTPNHMMESIARYPDVFLIEEDLSELKEENKTLLKAFRLAMEKCLKERIREGKSLKTDLLKHLDELERCVQEMKSLREEANANLEKRFEQRLKDRNVQVDATRFAQEVVIQLEKSDINEELSRLHEHTRVYRELLDAKQVEGKKLDFYTQELLREVNTIGSKSQVAKLTQVVVEAKTTIERIREQVQNVE